MEWPIIVAIILAIPVILIPIAFIFYLNMGGIIAVLNGRKRSSIAKWLFDFERKGAIAWEKQDTEVKQYYLKHANRLIDRIKER